MSTPCLRVGVLLHMIVTSCFRSAKPSETLMQNTLLRPQACHWSLSPWHCLPNFMLLRALCYVIFTAALVSAASLGANSGSRHFETACSLIPGPMLAQDLQ